MHNENAVDYIPCTTAIIQIYEPLLASTTGL